MTNRSPWYISTSIPYVNGRPHIGHAMEYVITDALARSHRARGEDVRFQTGSDDNSLTNVRAAEREGIVVPQLVERNTGFFLELCKKLDISFDDFIRTSTDPRHLEGAAKLWRACLANEDIYTKSYRGLYCVNCELFYTEDELVDGLCPEHLKPLEVVEEENYFFRLSRYAEDLERLISSQELLVLPETRRNEVLSFIRMGLNDFSVSRSTERSRGWGVPVPGDDTQVMYVWFDALSNYINAIDYAGEGELYQRYWADNPHRTHIIGKDILRFHAVYWPAILLSAGIPLPTTVFVHGFITVGGTRMSKTIGNVLDPAELADKYGTETLRYFLLAKTPAAEDSDFTLERFVRAHNSDLADQLGNLVSRVVAMVERYFDGKVPAPSGEDPAAGELMEVAKRLPEAVASGVDSFALHESMAAIWDLISLANRYVVMVAPWDLAKHRDADSEASARLESCLYNLVEVLRVVAANLEPFLPSTAAEILRRIGLDDASSTTGWGAYPAGSSVLSGPSLFPKLEPPDPEAT